VAAFETTSASDVSMMGRVRGRHAYDQPLFTGRPSCPLSGLSGTSGNLPTIVITRSRHDYSSAEHQCQRLALTNRERSPDEER
jgi:hypothetical protein